MTSDMGLNSLFWMRAWRRRGAWLLAILALWWLLGWFWVPVWVKHQLESALTEQLGRPVSVQAVEFRPWSLDLWIDGLAMAGLAAAVDTASGPTPAQATIKRIYIDGSWQSLWRLAPVLDSVAVDSPQVSVTCGADGHSDLDDVWSKLSSQPATPDQSVFRFALSNLQLSDGAVTLQDQARGRIQRLTHLQLKLPFLSSLAAHRAQSMAGGLTLDFNGHPIDFGISGIPFGADPKTVVQLKVKELDLAPYVAYLPPNLPLTVRAATLDSDLNLSFEHKSPNQMTISGALALRAVSLGAAGAAKSGHELLGFDRLSVQFNAVRPLAQEVRLGRVDGQGLRLQVARDRRGQLNWSTVFKPGSVPGTGAPATASPAWQFDVEQLSLDGQVVWNDASTVKPARLRLDVLALQAHSLAWPLRQPIPIEGKVQLDQAVLNFQGKASERSADLTAKLSNAPLALAAPYLAERLTAKLDGILNADAQLHWRTGGAKADQWQLQLPRLTLDKLALTAADNKPWVRAARLELADVMFNSQMPVIKLGRARLSQPAIRVVRAADGHWMVQDWLKTGAKAPAAKSSDGRSDKPWALAVADLRLTGGSLAWRDATQDRPVSFDLDDVSLQLRDLNTVPGKSFSLRLDARMRHGHAESGRLAWRGSASLTPLAIQGALNAERLPLHALAPYLSDRLNVELRRADASFKGDVRYANPASGMQLQVKGNARLEDVLAFTLAQRSPLVAARELLNLKTLSLDGLGLVMQPGKATQFEVRETVLSDFYARITLHENGRFNLQDLTRPTAHATDNTARPDPSLPGAAGDDPAQEAVIRIGPTSLQGGRVDFTDHFIQPNYATQLSGLAGRLGAFASQNAAGALQLADVELRGRAEGSATLEILGKINPLTRPLALDVQGRVRDLELSPLSTYAARYTGYGIEHGKLSVDVAYKVDSDGQLSARNDIVLNQLKFGDAVQGAQSSLPVKLAVALLADRNGVININLPITGSLKDPQFRLMPIVFRLIGQLVMKAVTAPFSLLAHIFSDDDGAFRAVRFAPGSAMLDAQAQLDLAKVAQVMQERPALKMTVVASASLQAEREALQRAQLHNLVQIEKRQRGATGPVSEQEYPELLRAVYRRASFAKPRNMIGLTKDIPVPDMQALLMANAAVTETDIQMLAIQRGVAVRDYLAALQLPMDRLFLGASKTQVLDAVWQPQAELNLSVE